MIVTVDEAKDIFGLDKKLTQQQARGMFGNRADRRQWAKIVRASNSPKRQPKKAHKHTERKGQVTKEIGRMASTLDNHNQPDTAGSQQQSG